MGGSGGVGFVIDTATIFLLLLVIAALGMVWLWRKRR